MVTRRTSGLPLICLVCGDVARGINFNVMTCMSCKTFFRRHTIKSDSILQCQLENNCKITQRTRGFCSACRFQKCFALGMDPKLVGNRFHDQTKSNHIQYLKINCLPKPLPLSLLGNDRSTLTINEWNLLSNILHTYDAVSVVPQIKYLLEQQSSLPPKIRSKPSATFDIIKFFYSTFQPFVERLPYFRELSSDTCRALVRHNSETFGTLNSIFVMREVNVFGNPAFLTGCHNIYGVEALEQFHEFARQFEQNGIFIKIMLSILAFSTNCSVVIPDYSENNLSEGTSVSIINVQNLLITVFWKYLIYQYGFFTAVRWFNSFIQYVLVILQKTNETSHEQHNNMIDTIVEESIRLLAIDDA